MEGQPATNQQSTYSQVQVYQPPPYATSAPVASAPQPQLQPQTVIPNAQVTQSSQPGMVLPRGFHPVRTTCPNCNHV